MAEEARVAFNLETVLFIPAGEPPHKYGYPVSGTEHRYAMTLLGTASNPAFKVSRIEIERRGPSYSVDTIREVKETYGAEIYFIVGADEALDLVKWHKAELLPDLARFIAVPRPGFDLPRLSSALPPRFLSRVEVLPALPMDISSTEIRRRVREGESIRYMVPEGVESYIRKWGLYMEGK
jgi:nicotinate-nucleotide adenylyltransferase